MANLGDHTSTINVLSEVVAVAPEAKVAQVTKIVALTIASAMTVPMVPTVSVNLRKKPNKYNSVGFKRWK